jgi:hypothetical protein
VKKNILTICLVVFVVVLIGGCVGYRCCFMNDENPGLGCKNVCEVAREK